MGMPVAVSLLANGGEVPVRPTSITLGNGQEAPTLVCDSSTGRVVQANAALVALVGYARRSELVGRLLSELMEGDTRLRTCDGGAIEVELLYVPTQQQHVVRFVGYVGELARLRAERQRLDVANAVLNEGRRKNVEAMDFLSHELKNRFVAVRGLVESANLSVAEHAPHLLTASLNLQEVLTDALAEIDCGTFLCMNQGIALQLAHDEYTPRAINLELKSALHAVSSRRADVTIDSSVPPLVHLDGNLLLYTLDQFVCNAAHYGGKHGDITVHASRCEGRLRFEVTNLPGERHAATRSLYGDGDAVAAIVATGQVRSPSPFQVLRVELCASPGGEHSHLCCIPSYF
jgi:signal transduction histidine kinase